MSLEWNSECVMEGESGEQVGGELESDYTVSLAADNRTRANHRYKFRAIGASSTGLHYSFAVRTVSAWNQLPAVVVEQENPVAFRAQLARCAPVRMP